MEENCKNEKNFPLYKKAEEKPVVSRKTKETPANGNPFLYRMDEGVSKFSRSVDLFDFKPLEIRGADGGDVAVEKTKINILKNQQFSNSSDFPEEI